MLDSMIIFLQPELQQLNEIVFKPCGLELTKLIIEKEGKEYSAQNFQLNSRNLLFRKAKVTPTKTGQFVTIWKRNALGITAPYDVSDDFQFYIVVTQTDDKKGVFIFPKEVLYANAVLSGEKSKGKRGIRVYPPWDTTTSKQAQKTQKWQTSYFLELPKNNKVDLQRAQLLLNINQ